MRSIMKLALASNAIFWSVRAAESQCEKGRDKINWFLLQESVGWRDTFFWRDIAFVQDAHKIVVEFLQNKFARPRCGAALFENVDDHYSLLSDLTDDTEKITAFRKEIKGHGHTGKWAAAEQDFHVINYEEGYAYFKPTAPLEPVIWASLTASWDTAPNALRFLTVNTRHIPNHDGDGSSLDKEQSKYEAFDTDVMPASAKEIWPAGTSPRLSKQSRYTTLALVKEVLEDKDVRLMVNWLPFDHGSPKQAWENVLGALGIDIATYLRPVIATNRGQLMSDNILTALEHARCTHPKALCDGGLSQINWFLLQEYSGWASVKDADGKPTLSSFHSSVVQRLRRRFSGPKFGAAMYEDVHRSYVLLSDLTDVDEAILKIQKGFDEIDSGVVGKWAATEEGLKELGYNEARSVYHPKAPLEPIIWASLQASWDMSSETLRFITVNSRFVPHFAGDGSKAEVSQRQYGDFTLETFPANDETLWPSNGHFRLSNESNYASFALVKETLESRDIRLLVNWAPMEDGSPRKAWSDAVEALGVDSSKFLKAIFSEPHRETISENTLSALEVLRCSALLTTTPTPETTSTNAALSPTTVSTDSMIRSSDASTLPTNLPLLTSTAASEYPSHTVMPTSTAATLSELSTLHHSGNAGLTSEASALSSPTATSTDSLSTISGIPTHPADLSSTEPCGPQCEKDGHCPTHCKCTGEACWKSLGVFVEVAERPKVFDLKIVN